MKRLATRSRSVSHGETATQDFCAAPKVDFPKLSQKLTGNLADPGDCEHIEIDHDRFYVIGQVIPATSLAKLCGR